MEQAVRHDSYLGFLSRAVRRHLLLVAVVVLVGVALSGAYVAVTPVRYAATANLLPRPLLGNPLGPDISASSGTQLTVAMQTEAGLVDIPAVGALATQSLGITVPRSQDKVIATVPPNTQIISITYSSNTAVHAQQGAQAFAKAFLTYRENVSLAAQQQTLTSLEKQRVIARDALKRAAEAIFPNSDPRSFASQQELQYSNQLAALQNRISSTQALSTNPGIVVTSASVPLAAAGLHPYVIVVAGALLGFALGLVLAGARERRRDLVDEAVEHDVCGLPLLASLPGSDPGVPRIVSDLEPVDALPEAYRRMRAGFVAVAGELKVFSIACVSLAGTSGPIAVNLGICLAQAGFRVTVVATDSDERISELLRDTASSPGLSDVLLAQTSLDDSLQDVNGVRFLPAGQQVAMAREHYAGPALKSVIEKLGMESDFVLVASAGVSTADADSVALACEGVLVVVSQGVTTHAETAAAIERYGELKVSTVGAVSLSQDGPQHSVPRTSAGEAPEGRGPRRESARRARKRSGQPKPGFGTDG